MSRFGTPGLACSRLSRLQTFQVPQKTRLGGFFASCAQHGRTLGCVNPAGWLSTHPMVWGVASSVRINEWATRAGIA
jgi:hypothetical protein